MNNYPNYGFDPNNQVMFQNQYQYDNQAYYKQAVNGQDDRFFLAPFVVGGLAGTALGYGIANNNNKGCCMQPMYVYPQSQVYPYPYMFSSNSNNYYY